MTKLSLIALAVICSRPSGYRRAGFSLEQGKNLLDTDQAGYDALKADKHLTVAIVSENSSIALDEQLNNGDLEDQVTILKNKCIEQQDIIEQLRTELKDAKADNHIDKISDLAGGEMGLDVGLAPVELHRWIVIIDELNKISPLARKPNCDQLKAQVPDEALPGETITINPTGAQRDDAWAWYKENVKIVKAVDANQKAEA